MERGVASRRRRLVTVRTGRPRDPVRRALRPGCEELAARIRSKCRRRKRGTGAQNRHGGAPRGERLPRDARRLARRLACRVKARPTGAPSTRTLSRRSATPHPGARSKKSKTRAQKRAAGTKIGCLEGDGEMGPYTQGFRPDDATPETGPSLALRAQPSLPRRPALYMETIVWPLRWRKADGTRPA